MYTSLQSLTCFEIIKKKNKTQNDNCFCFVVEFVFLIENWFGFDRGFTSNLPSYRASPRAHLPDVNGYPTRNN